MLRLYHRVRLSLTIIGSGWHTSAPVHVALLPFLAISILLIVIPGPDTAMVTKNAVAGGRRSGVYAAFGVSVGLTIWTAAAALGIAALLRASEIGFDILKFAGAIYLTWVGIQMLRSRGVVARSTRRARTGSGKKAFRQGLLSDLGNPEDRGLLHEPAAAVRARDGVGVHTAALPRASSSRC